MIMELTTTSLGVASGVLSLGGASVLSGGASTMDSYRKFFLGEKASIDEILENSRDFEDKYSINDNAKTVDSVLSGGSSNPLKDKGDDETSSAAILASASADVVKDGIRSWFNYKYLVFACLVGAVVKIFSGKKRVVTTKGRGYRK